MQTAEEKLRQRLLGLVDKASQDHDTQRIVAAVLEGTFFNLMQVNLKGIYCYPRTDDSFVLNVL